MRACVCVLARSLARLLACLPDCSFTFLLLAKLQAARCSAALGKKIPRFPARTVARYAIYLALAPTRARWAGEREGENLGLLMLCVARCQL